MAKDTSIQWADSTINPIMGCGGCELFPSPRQVLATLRRSLRDLGLDVDVRAELLALITAQPHIAAHVHAHPADLVTTTNLWHFRELLGIHLAKKHGKAAGKAVEAAMKREITCYAFTLHANRGESLLNPSRRPNRGYAPTFEQLTRFPGRVREAAGWSDLRGTRRPGSPWKDDLPRLIFVSDMGDALTSANEDTLAFLEREVIEPVRSDKGRRHQWIFLTKRPIHMAKLGRRIGGFPGNLCAMTTVTSRKTLGRVDQLRKVDAHLRGLSVEPLWERLPPTELDLTGIDWLILGGESGSRKHARPFDLAWAEELREHCRVQGVAFFLKQLGRNPVVDGKRLPLADPHGGDWNEWPDHLRVREFPEKFMAVASA